MMDQVFRRLSLMCGLGKLTVWGRKRAQATLLADEVLPNLRHVQNYGHEAHPLPGAETVVLFPSGDRSFGLVVVVGDERHRPTLQPGESALYAQGGAALVLHTNNTATLRVAKLLVQGDVEISGSLKAGATELASVKVGGVDIGPNHHHQGPNGSTTGAVVP